MGEGSVEVRSEKIDKCGSEHFYNIGVDGIGIIFIGTERLDSILDQLLTSFFFKKTSNHTFILRVVSGNILIIIDVVGKLVRSFVGKFVRTKNADEFMRTNSFGRVRADQLCDPLLFYV